MASHRRCYVGLSVRRANVRFMPTRPPAGAVMKVCSGLKISVQGEGGKVWNRRVGELLYVRNPRREIRESVRAAHVLSTRFYTPIFVL